MRAVVREVDEIVDEVDGRGHEAQHDKRRRTADDGGREFHGLKAIQEWSDREIFAAQVTLEVVDAVERDGETLITTKVDGTFDRTACLIHS